MNYKILYRKMNQRRKVEFEQCEKSLDSLKNLYEKIVEYKNSNDSEDHSELFDLCNNACCDLEELYQQFIDTDKLVGNLYIDLGNDRNVVHILNCVDGIAK